METWYSVELGDGIKAYALTNEIQNAFWPVYISSGSPKDMGVYSNYDLDKIIVTIYFTPAAKMLAETFKAKPCKEPSSEKLSFIAGPGTCLDFWPVGQGRYFMKKRCGTIYHLKPDHP